MAGKISFKETMGYIASSLFIEVWGMYGVARTVEEDDTLLHSAHAYCYYWSETGLPFDKTRGEWLLSRTYGELGKPDLAIYYADKCLSTAEKGKAGSFALACAYEGLARAHALANNNEKVACYMAKAREAAADVKNKKDRRTILEIIETMPVN